MCAMADVRGSPLLLFLSRQRRASSRPRPPALRLRMKMLR
jgi:hypothetical protein